MAKNCGEVVEKLERSCGEVVEAEREVEREAATRGDFYFFCSIDLNCGEVERGRERSRFYPRGFLLFLCYVEKL